MDVADGYVTFVRHSQDILRDKVNEEVYIERLFDVSKMPSPPCLRRFHPKCGKTMGHMRDKSHFECCALNPSILTDKASLILRLLLSHSSVSHCCEFSFSPLCSGVALAIMSCTFVLWCCVSYCLLDLCAQSSRGKVSLPPPSGLFKTVLSKTVIEMKYVYYIWNMFIIYINNSLLPYSSISLIIGWNSGKRNYTVNTMCSKGIRWQTNSSSDVNNGVHWRALLNIEIILCESFCDSMLHNCVHVCSERWFCVQ